MYTLFSLAVMVTATFAGLGPGIFATVLSALGVAYFFLPPTNHILPIGFPDGLGLAIFLLSGFLMSSAAAFYHRTQKRSILAMEELAAQQRIGDALRKSEDLFRGTFENAPVGITHIDSNGHWLRVNSRFCEMIGYSRQELFQKSFWDLTHPDDVWEDVEPFALLVRGQIDHYELEKRYLHKDGHAIWVHLSRSLQRDEQGKPLYSINSVLDITDRKNAEKALLASEARLRGTLQSILDEVWIVDAQGRLVLISESVRENLGVAPGHWNDIYAALAELEILRPDGTPRPDDEAPLPRALRGENLIGQKEIARNLASGELRWREVTGAPILDPDGGITGAVVIARDITDRVRAEEALRTSEERLQRAISTPTVGVLFFSLRGRIHEANAAFERMSGYSSEELQHIEHWQALTAPEYWDATIRKAGELASRGETEPYEKQMIRKDGSLWWGLFAPMRLSGSGINSECMEFIVDISDRKRAEEKLRRREEVLAQAGYMAHLGAWEIDFLNLDNLNANPLVWSDEVYRIFGHEPGSIQVTNDLFFQHVHPEDQQKVAEAFKIAAFQKRPYSIEHRIIRADGHERIVLEHAQPTLDEQDRLLRMVGAVQDITERKKAEEGLQEAYQRLQTQTAELDKALEQLKQSNKDLEHFAYVASHDLQEPLRMVSGHLGMLQRRYRGKLGEDADDFIHYAVDGAKRMSEMIQGLLEFSRVGQKKKPAVPVDSRQALEHALQALGTRIRESGADITFDGLPVVMADEVQLTRVFQNLIGNAIKFRREDIKPAIHIGAELRGDEWLIMVADNGIGIDPKHHERVFDLFERLHSTDKYSGSGMGLSICRRIIEQWGGAICLGSEQDKGTTFYFTLRKANNPHGGGWGGA